MISTQPMQKKKMSKAEFFKVFVPACTASTSERQSKVGFENTGIYPMNRNAPKILKKQKCSEFLGKLKGKDRFKTPSNTNVNKPSTNTYM